MRVVQNPQMQIGEADISQIRFDPKSRDDIPKILRGLQHLYMDIPLRTKIFQLLETEISPEVSKCNGRPGMALWKILVCGVVRLDLNEDYDRLHELVNHHDTIREMLGHAAFDEETYHYQTLKDNVSLFTPELLDKINQLVVSAGHVLVKKKEGEALRGRCDSFVVETDVHFPTDINLLYDAMRKVITLTAQWCDERDVSDWRQHAYNVRHLKRLMRAAQNRKRSKAKSEKQQNKNETLIVKAHQEYLDVAERYLQKARATIALFERQGFTGESDIVKKLEIEGFMQHAVRQIDQTKRRVINGEIIPHDEKVFSIFDRNWSACSFDKGFHSPGNRTVLKEQLEQVVLPGKGKLSQLARAAEQTEPFIKARHAHSAVESAINALEVHGLDMCPDHGIDGFKRYIAFAVVARNIHRIGDILWKQEQLREQRKRKYSDRDPPYKRAA